MLALESRAVCPLRKGSKVLIIDVGPLRAETRICLRYQTRPEGRVVGAQLEGKGGVTVPLLRRLTSLGLYFNFNYIYFFQASTLLLLFLLNILFLLFTRLSWTIFCNVSHRFPSVPGRLVSSFPWYCYSATHRSTTQRVTGISRARSLIDLA